MFCLLFKQIRLLLSSKSNENLNISNTNGTLSGGSNSSKMSSTALAEVLCVF